MKEPYWALAYALKRLNKEQFDWCVKNIPKDKLKYLKDKMLPDQIKIYEKLMKQSG